MFNCRVAIATKNRSRLHLIKGVALGVWLLLVGCVKNDNRAPSFPPAPTGDPKPIRVLVYPKSKHLDSFYQKTLQEIQRTEERIKQEIDGAQSAEARENWSSYLADIQSGAAFLVPFAINNWQFVIPSRIFKEPGNQFLVIGRFLPEDADVVVLAELNPDSTAKEVREAFKRLLSSSIFDKGNLRKNANFRSNALFGVDGEMNDPLLKGLLKDQSFIQQH